MKLSIEILFWRILRKSGVFNYWFKKFLTELLYDFEIFDLEKEDIIKKYSLKLQRLSDPNRQGANAANT